ncbi:hypothetical protein AB0K89_24680 [Streptomyces cinnamoneus]|uniref:hypothetical protein n=1 Tax=Streptomyces cinnamoneus TaxID=53446 RepID=UPI00342E1136
MHQVKSPRRTQVAFCLAAAWAAGAALVPVCWSVGVVWAWAGGLPGLAAAFGAGGAAMVAWMFAAGTAVRDVVPACRTAARRLGWAVAVVLGGSAGVALGYRARLSGDVDLGGDTTLFLWCGVPYALVAALFVPGRAARAVAGTAVAGTVALVAWAGHEGDRAKELASLLEGSPLSRKQLLVPEAPDGYAIDEGNGSVSGQGFRLGYRYAGSGAARETLQYEVVPGNASPCADTTLPGPATCTDLDGGFVEATRRLGDGSPSHTLALRRDGLTLSVTVSGPADTPRLRRMLTKAHPAADDELLRALRFRP